MSNIKSNFDIEQLREAGRLAAVIVDQLGKELYVGQSAAEIDARARELCLEHGVEPSFLGFEGYRYALCVSVNDEIVHGIPYAEKIIRDGDLVKIDFGVKYRGYNSDHCRTFGVGALSEQRKKLLWTGEAATANAVALVRDGARVGDLSYAMQSTAEKAGFSVVKMYVGHGIGKKLHEPPEIPAFGKSGTGETLRANMVICVECQVCVGSGEAKHDTDGWTARTKDGSDCVMFESMVRVLPDGCENFTALA